MSIFSSWALGFYGFNFPKSFMTMSISNQQGIYTTEQSLRLDKG